MAEVQPKTKSRGSKPKRPKEEGAKSIMKRLSIGKIYKGSKKKQMIAVEPGFSQEAAGSREDVGKSSEDLEKSNEEPGRKSVEPVQVLVPSSEETLSSDHRDDDDDVTQEVLEEEEEEEEEEKTSRDATTSTNSDTEATSGGMKRECLYKILVIGELGAGKTSIIKRYVHQFFSQHYRATIGVDFALKVLNWDQNTIIRLQLWDIAGQERFGNMTRVYYKEAVGAFIVFDVTRSATFDAVLKWKQDLDSKVQLPDGSPIPCLLLGNKCDQQKEGPVNNQAKMDEYCKTNNFTAWYLTSAKDNINIEEAAKTLVAEILKNDTSSENGRGGIRDSSRFPLEGHSELGSESKSCAC